MSAELTNLIKNLIRIGHVSEVDAPKYRVRVQWGEDEAGTTDWIRWGTTCAGDVKHWRAPSIGEEVCVLSADGDLRNAFVLCSFFNDDNPPPSTSADEIVNTYSDGTRETHTLSASSREITGLGTLTKTIDTTNNNSNTHNKGKLTSNGKNVSDSHTHTGVAQGRANTGDVT